MNDSERYLSTQRRIEQRNRLQNKLMVRNLLIGAALICALSILVGFSQEANAQSKWESDYLWSMGSGCTATSVAFHYTNALNEIAYVSTIRQSDKPFAGSALDGTSLVFCSDKQPPVALSNDPLSGSAPLMNASGTIGYAWWWWHSDGHLIECDVWIKNGIDSVRDVLKHEAGHCMGLFEHSSDPDSVMYNSVQTSQWSAEDMLRMAELYEGCPRTGRTTDDLTSLMVTRYKSSTVYGFLDAGGVWPDDLYNYNICD